MDYDDNHIQYSNLQLAGEERSKSSFVLAPYTFPKFEFCDSLQGQLRFDNLVETEVFLGIHFQEDNQWIEDLSKGSNESTLSSSAADPHSISRCNNVWSEASSSRSMAMPLKSIGQEEMKPGGNIIPEFEANNVKNILSEEMQPNCKQGERNDVDVGNSKAALPRSQDNTESTPQDVWYLLTQVNMIPPPKGSSNLHCNAATEGLSSFGSEFEDNADKQPKFSIHESLCLRSGEVSSDATSLVDNCSSSLPSDPPQQVGHLILESDSGLRKNVVTPEDVKNSEGNISQAGIYSKESSCSFVPVSKCLDIGDTVETSTLWAKELSSRRKESELEVQGGKSPAQPGKCEIELSSCGTDANQLVEGSNLDKSQVGGVAPHASDLDGISADPGLHSEQKMDSVLHGQDRDKGQGVTENSHRRDGEVSMGVSESTLNSGGENKFSGEKFDDISSDLEMPLPVAELSMQNNQVESIEENKHGFTLDIAESSERAHFSTTVVDNSVPVCEETIAFRPVAACENEQDVSRVKGDVQLLTDSKVTSSHCVVTQTSNQITSSENTIDGARRLQPQTSEMESGEPPQTEETKPDYCKSTSKEDDNANAVSGGNHEDTMLKCTSETEMVQAAVKNFSRSATAANCGSICADAEKAACSSPPIISSSKSSQNQRGKREESRASEVTDGFAKSTPSLYDDRKQKDASRDDGSFTFKVNSLPEISKGDQGKTDPVVDSCKSLPLVEGYQPSSSSKTYRKMSHETSGPKVSDEEPADGTPKSTFERKQGRASARGTRKESAKKGNQVKDITTEKALGKGKVSRVSLIPSGTIQHGQFAEMQCGRSEQNNPKLSGCLTPVTNLSDLSTSYVNISASPSAKILQPFTDLQQVQLRAQIFVYGSLIQGTVPDETCMVSAFGPSDGRRSMWEHIWRAAVERIRNKKSNGSCAETSVHSHSAPAVSDTSGNQSLHNSKVPPSPLGQASSRTASATVINPVVPASSSLESISATSCDVLPPSSLQKGTVVEYQRPVSPLDAFQIPNIRNFVGHTTWPSPVTFSAPLVTSPQTSAFNSGAHFPNLPLMETVKLAPVKDSSVPSTSSLKHATSSPVVGTTELSSLFAGSSKLSDPKKDTVFPEQHRPDSKPRKRKKIPDSVLSPIPVISQAQREPVVLSSVTMDSSPAVTVATLSGAVFNTNLSKSSLDSSPASLIGQSTRGDLNTGKAAMYSEDTLNKVAEAKVQAENAAALAAAAVSQSEDLWTQMAKQESVLTSEVEAKLASAAVAVAAAASVAKAAAAAAKVASSAAFQAKLMADEALLSSQTGISAQITDEHNMVKATHASVLKGGNETCQPSSILVSARETAKRRVEAVSAVSKQAENLDALVKAAELAAEAVSQAGKVVAMGDPLPLSELIEAGPEGCWKLHQSSCNLSVNLSSKNGGRIDGKVDEGADISVDVFEDLWADKRATETPNNTSPRSAEGLDHTKLLTVGSSSQVDKDSTSQRAHEVFEVAKSGGVPSEPVTMTSSSGTEEPDKIVDVLPENPIKEGSTVEVFKNGDGFKSAWYSANVLNIENGKAYVLYTELSSDEGSGGLKEWVALEREGDKMPFIRAACPLNPSQYQGTRKRRRSAIGDYSWAIGDKVDAWIDDCWWEGVITEKSEKDETELTVQFPAQGKTSVVRAWNVRPSRMWKSGKWVEWTCSRDRDSKGDTPHEKRQKLGSIPPVELKESKLLPLSASEQVFNIGNDIVANNEHARKTARGALPKREGSRVIFGVPKPTGKKQKFVEVSKKFTADETNKTNKVNDSVKFTKYLIPRATAPRRWRSPPKNDSKEKRAPEPEPKPKPKPKPRLKPKIPSSSRPYSDSARNLLQRDNPGSQFLATSDTSDDLETKAKDSVVDDEGNSENSSPNEHEDIEEAAEGPLSSLLACAKSASSKKISSLSIKSGRVNKGKLAPSRGKLSKIEEGKVESGNPSKLVSEVVEPRRSIRRIQPTHKLLEGLQSSLLISKMPAISHDKSHKTQSRIASARGK